MTQKLIDEVYKPRFGPLSMNQWTMIVRTRFQQQANISTQRSVNKHAKTGNEIHPRFE